MILGYTIEFFHNYQNTKLADLAIPFWPCFSYVKFVTVTTSQGPPWLAINDAMHRNGSGSTVSRHQFSADMLEAKVS